jgi:hypothetical protein
MQILRRRIGPLLTSWIILLGVAGLLYWWEMEMPAVRDILTPVYIVLGLGVLYATFRWIRTRSSNRRARRDRRRNDRRGGDDEYVAGEG